MKEREILVKDTPLTNFDEFRDKDILDFFQKYSGCPKEIRGKEIVSHNVSGIIPHKSYIDYLEIAYNTDYGIIIKPDYIWFTILNEISYIINKNVEKFRKYFTESKEKIQIVGKGESMIELPVHEMMNLVLEKIPIKLNKSVIIPSFSTSDDDSRFAFAVSFLETISPYYGLGFYGCDYNKIKIYGEEKDYQLMIESLNTIKNKIPDLNDYIGRIIETINKIIQNWSDNEFWRKILWTKKGYLTDDMDGWIFGICDKDYCQTQLSKIEYEEKFSKIEYILISGLLSSKVEDGYLVPNFEKIIAKKNSNTTKNIKEEDSEWDYTKNSEWDYSIYRDLFSVKTKINYSDFIKFDNDQNIHNI